MKKSWLILSVFLLILGLVNAGTITISNITSPTSGSYWKNGSHNIVFKVYAEDVNGASGQADLNVKLYYSASAGAFTTLIGDYNLINTSYCGSTNDFNVSGGVQCTIPWTMSISSDGNYYIDINAYTYRLGTLTGDDGTGSSSSFYVDNTVPAAPTSFVVEQLSSSSVRLHWDKNTTSDPREWYQYRIWYSTSEFTDCTSATNYATSTDNTIDSYDITGLTAGQTYYFCVTKKDLAGNETGTTSRIKAFLVRKDVVPGPLVRRTKTTTTTSTTATESSKSVSAVEQLKNFINKTVFTVGGFSVTGGVVIILLLGYYFLIYKNQGKKK